MSSAQRPYLLQIPFELRRQIYDVVLCLPARDHLSLLSTCRQIQNEAHIYLYRRHIVLNSQRALHLFVHRSSRAMLEQVTILTLRLEDARPEEHLPVLGQLANEGLPFGSPSHPLYREYQVIIRLLRQLPSVVDLSILPPKGRTSYPPPDLVEGVLNFTCMQWPSLSKFTFLLENVSLLFLSRLQKLTALHLTGFSLTSPRQTADILSRLPQLSNLCLTASEVRPQYETKLASGRRIVQSFTSATVCQTSSLRSLSISEKLDRQREVPAFISHEILAAIRDQLAVNLIQLKIVASMALDKETVSDIGEILCAAQYLELVDIGWHNVEPSHEVLEMLPKSVTSVSLALPSSRWTESVVEDLRPSLDRLTNLQHLNLFVIDEERDSGLSSLTHNAAWRQLSIPSKRG